MPRTLNSGFYVGGSTDTQSPSSAAEPAGFDTCAAEEGLACRAGGQHTCHKEEDGGRSLAADVRGVVRSPCRLLLDLEDWGRAAMMMVVVVADNSMPAVRLDMRPAVDGSPTVEADTVLGCLDRLTLADLHGRFPRGPQSPPVF